MERIKPYELPQPWELSAEWLSLLGIKDGNVRRSFLSLRKPERQWLECVRQLFYYYQKLGIGRGKTLLSLVKEQAHHLDEHWLAAGYGRAVDIKRSLHVLETFAQYRQWAEKIARYRGICINLVCPYWVEETAKLKYGGSGLVRLTIRIRRPTIHTLYDVRWETATIHLREVRLEEQGDIDLPFLVTKTKEDRLTKRDSDSFSKIKKEGEEHRNAVGFVGRLVCAFEEALTVPDFPLTKEYLRSGWISPGWSTCQIDMDKPTQAQIAAFLQVFADFYAAYHPQSGQGPAWQLCFDVSEELTSITHSCQPVS